MATVLQFKSTTALAAEMSKSRNRREALSAIVPRLLNVMLTEGEPVEVVNNPGLNAHLVKKNGLEIIVGVFRGEQSIQIRQAGQIVFSCSLFGENPQMTIDKVPVRVSTWKRTGWEPLLFHKNLSAA